MPYNEVEIKQPYANVDSVSLTSHLSLLQDAYMNEFGGVVKRFGTKQFVDLQTNRKIDGMFWSETKGVLIVVSDGQVFKINDKFGTITNLTGTDAPISGRNVTFCEIFNGSTLYLFMANGNGLIFTDYTAATQKVSASSTPPQTGSLTIPDNITHVVNFNNYIVFNVENSNSWFFSNPNLPFKYDVSDSYDTEKSPDPVNAIAVVNNRLLLCGKSTIEPWHNVGQAGDPLLRSLKTSFVDLGVIAPYSISVINESAMFMLDKNNRVTLIYGAEAKVVSKPYDRIIQNYSAVSDAVSFTINLAGKSFYLISFPQQKKTLAYDIELDVWSEWGSWNETSSQYEMFNGNCSQYANNWNMTLIGGLDGKVYSISEKYKNDNGTTIRASIITGHINWGTDAIIKNSKKLVARIKTGEGKYNDEHNPPYFLIRKKDDGKQNWSNFKKISLGKIGRTEFTKTLYHRGGRYRSRQYEVVMPDDASFVIADLWEDIN